MVLLPWSVQVEVKIRFLFKVGFLASAFNIVRNNTGTSCNKNENFVRNVPKI